jgi:hypothetical protein
MTKAVSTVIASSGFLIPYEPTGLVWIMAEKEQGL